MVELLTDSNVAKYLEFKAVSKLFTLTKDSRIEQVWFDPLV